MDSNNWKNCIDGNCLWFDGVDDYAVLDVEDWSGNFTISQWVWANTTNQSNYSSTFAIDNTLVPINHSNMPFSDPSGDYTIIKAKVW